MGRWRDALRFTSTQPFLTIVIAAMLALGIGGATAMFSAVQGVLLKPLPYEHPEALVWMFGAFRQADSAAVSPRISSITVPANTSSGRWARWSLPLRPSTSPGLEAPSGCPWPPSVRG